MTICGSCEEDMASENDPDIIRCVNCSNMFHPRCAGVTKSLLKSFTTLKNLAWFCDDCNETRDFKSVLMSKLRDLESIIKCQNEKHLNQEREINGLKKMVDQLISKKCDSTHNTPSVGKRKWCDVVSDGVTCTPNEASKRQKQHNSVPIAQRKLIPDKSDAILIVKPKDAKADEAVKTALVSKVKSVLNPVTDPVKKLRETSKGNIVIECQNEEAAEQLKQKINQACGDSCEVSEPKLPLPMIKVVGIDCEYRDQRVLLNALNEQNPTVILSSSNVEIVEVRDQKQQKKCTATLRVDLETFKRVMVSERLSVGWNRCRVFEHVNVLRCYRCSEFANHIASQCKAPEFVCGVCSGSHSTTLCITNERKCINCMKANEMLNMRNDVNHSSLSMECPVLRKKTEQRKQNMRYQA